MDCGMFREQHRIPKVQLTGKLGGLSLPQQVAVLAFWPFVQNLMGFIVSFVDMMLAGRMERSHLTESQLSLLAEGTEVSRAMIEMMSPIMYIGWLLMILQGAVATGAQALIARATGARDRPLAEQGLGQSLVLGALAGVFAWALIWIFANPIVSAIGLSETAGGFAVEYMRVLAVSAPLSGILFVANAALRGSGDTLRPFIAMCVVNAVNIGMSCWFVYGMKMGPAGLAWGTVLGWLAGVFMILWVMRPMRSDLDEHDQPLVLRARHLGFNAPVIKRIWRVAHPSATEVLGMWAIHAIGFRFVAAITDPRGSEAVIGAHGLALRVESLSFMPGFALGMAASTLAGQYLGAKSEEMAKLAVRWCWMLGVVVMGSIGLGLVMFAEPLVALMAPDGGDQAAMAVEVVKICGFSQPLFATAMVMKMSMRGAGATRLVMIYSFSVMAVVRILVLGAAVHYFNATLLQAWLVMILDLTVQAAVFARLHFKGGWLKAKV